MHKLILQRLIVGMAFVTPLWAEEILPDITPASPEQLAQEAQSAVEIYSPRRPGGPLAPKLVSRVEQLEQSLQNITNQLEEINHRCQVLQQNYERLTTDMELRFREMAPLATPAVGGASATVAPTPKPAHAPAVVSNIDAVTNGVADDADVLAPPPADADSKEKYTYAKNLFNNGDYQAAEKAFRAFVKDYPKDVFAASAHYWLGESQLLLGQPKKAAVTFMNGYKKHPKSKKCPENLLGLAKSLAKMSDKAKACTTLDKIKTDYPDLSADLKKSIRQQQKTLKCGE